MRFYTFILLFSVLSIVWADATKGVKAGSWLLVQESGEVNCTTNCPDPNRGSGR